MPNYGCCAQSVVFPERRLEGFQNLLREPPFDDPGDVILEQYARDNDWNRWALEPSVFQHVGIAQSSEGRRRANTWNFSFERMGP